MRLKACEWPGGCSRGAHRALDTAPIGEPGRRWLCLHHAGAVWNARKQANRAAGRCPCGADVTPGYRSCARCRERACLEKRGQRALAARAGECSIVLPRQAGRRRAFLAAFCEGFNRSQRAARRRWFRAWNRSGGLSTGAVTVAVSVPWAGEGRAVTVAATCALQGPEATECPIRGVPSPALVENAEVSRTGGNR